jgi:glutamyl-Q tRNA(Asp) synthetase
LDIRPPAYHHHKLIVDAAGIRLAKRKNAPTLAAMRADGADPVKIIAGLRAGVLPDGFCFSD